MTGLMQLSCVILPDRMQLRGWSPSQAASSFTWVQQSSFQRRRPTLNRRCLSFR
uniref:Uncharacterized protein n=1 Tax=Utricularia reniformis TaxID=192314 RepID=A0A1Y0B4P7_9LAMI|nr:hypothetical protein AEK19_MT2212 [Utricularia reniformis]ART32357.1 hypothetical protein AEK19_MT2212 [Utricularia reniformis]